MEARQRALVAALDDMLGWLESGKVASHVMPSPSRECSPFN